MRAERFSLRRTLCWLAVVGTAAILACTAARRGGDGAPPAPRPRRVVVLSLDGAAAHDLHRLHGARAFGADGFARFFAQGEVADALVPVNPTLTAPSHISLATGFPPAATGIVSNWFHIAGEPFLERANGFAVPISTETLWEAARGRGKRVGVITWPGADDAGPRRRGDWGMAFVNTPLRGPQTALLGREGWGPAPAPLPAGVRSFAPALRATIALPQTRSLPAEELELVALDRTDDGHSAYDTLLLGVADWQAAGPLEAGSWERLVRGRSDRAGAAASWLKLLALAPDLLETRLYVGAAFRNHAYPESFARGLEGAGLLWPGPPDDRALEAGLEDPPGEPGTDLSTWEEQAERFAAFFFAALRFAARAEPWDLLLGYVPVIDEAGHELLLVDARQRGHSSARAERVAAARDGVFRAVDRELGRFLGELDLTTTAVVVVSDHGMAPIHTSVDAGSLLKSWGYLETNAAGEPVAEGSRATAVTSGAAAHLYLHLRGREPLGEVTAGEAGELLGELAERFRDFTVSGERPIAAVFTRAQAAVLGLDHPHSGDLILFAAPGYAFHGDRRPAAEAARQASALGQHGYLNREPAMHGIFLAVGAGVEPGRPGRIDATTIAPRVARWLGIEPPRPAPEGSW